MSRAAPMRSRGMVQGAWGVVAAHINELSSNSLRGFFPGFAFQIGVLIAAGAAPIEALQPSRHPARVII